MKLQNHIFSVTELNHVIKSVLEESFFSITLEGEISNFRPAASGHWYFSLKDNDSSISAVMFKNSSYKLNFRPKDGDKVKVRGKVTLYSQRGTYQIVCSTMAQFGEGDLLLMLEERKRHLANLGLFDPSLKKDIPDIPETIGIITSPTGAALQDILKVLNRRQTLSDILILPTLVQGNSAAGEIVKQLNKANSDRLCDLIILSRGGGSIEDLLPFSDESVVHAVYNSSIPVITGIGHEIDTSLADLAADVRAATPSAAAEIATEGSLNLYSSLSRIRTDMIHTIQNKISRTKTILKTFNGDYIKRNLISNIENRYITIENLKGVMIHQIERKLEHSRIIIENSRQTLVNLSPFKLFDKGYSWVSKDNKSISGQQIESGDEVIIKYKDGEITGVIK